MYVTIIKGAEQYLPACIDALWDSELGRQYFISQDNIERNLKGALAKEELYVALNADGECVGFLWPVIDGIFHIYPYLHVIAIKEEYRGQGIGHQLMDYFENVISEYVQDKLFLVVADFNPEGKRFYEKLGYKEMAALPDLYKTGVTEYLMMKDKRKLK